MSKKEKEPKVSNAEAEKEDKEAVAEEETVTEDTEKEASEQTEDGEEKAEDGEEKAEASEDEKGQKADKKDAIIEDLNDRLKRQMAEFDNFRKRSEKEKSGMYDMGAIAVLEKILPVIDNFERGLESAGDDAFSEGMQMIYKQLTNALTEMGVEPIPALGETFDPELHNAVMHEDLEGAGENEITQELQKGYKYHDSVVRHSMVKVAN